MWNSTVDKLLYRLLASAQGRGVDVVEGNVLVGVVKSFRLPAAVIIQVSVHTTPLNNTSHVEIGLTVTYKVNFFGDQFSAILGPPGAVRSRAWR